MTPVAIEADYAEELEGTLRRWQRSDIELPLHRGPKQVAVSVWAAGWASTGVFDVIGMEEAWS
ncbi:MAG: hypothetical protein H5T86_09840, partial [Armatimonadetes bacterium]|nr:hypothetical protein [Armatimonadota bacterium]